MTSIKKEQKHFVLVHGACHGAWCWYKVKPLLESAGHRVTVLDMAASGTNLKTIQETQTFSDYTKPLLDFLASLPSYEKVILVGHAFGGMNLGLAMETFPEKISVAVFLTAFLPDSVHQPSYALEKYGERTPHEAWMDTQFSPNSTFPEQILMYIGPKILSSKLYLLSPNEDIELAKILMRPTSLFGHDLSKAKKYSSERFGSVTKVYIICEEDKGIPKEFQEWMIQNSPVQQVINIEGADHMPMFSIPQQLSQNLFQIAEKYA